MSLKKSKDRIKNKTDEDNYREIIQSMADLCTALRIALTEVRTPFGILYNDLVEKSRTAVEKIKSTEGISGTDQDYEKLKEDHDELELSFEAIKHQLDMEKSIDYGSIIKNLIDCISCINMDAYLFDDVESIRKRMSFTIERTVQLCDNAGLEIQYYSSGSKIDDDFKGVRSHDHTDNSELDETVAYTEQLGYKFKSGSYPGCTTKIKMLKFEEQP